MKVAQTPRSWQDRCENLLGFPSLLRNRSIFVCATTWYVIHGGSRRAVSNSNYHTCARKSVSPMAMPWLTKKPTNRGEQWVTEASTHGAGVAAGERKLLFLCHNGGRAELRDSKTCEKRVCFVCFARLDALELMPRVPHVFFSDLPATSIPGTVYRYAENTTERATTAHELHL